MRLHAACRSPRPTLRGALGARELAVREVVLQCFHAFTRRARHATRRSPTGGLERPHVPRFADRATSMLESCKVARAIAQGAVGAEHRLRASMSRDLCLDPTVARLDGRRLARRHRTDERRARAAAASCQAPSWSSLANGVTPRMISAATARSGGSRLGADGVGAPMRARAQSIGSTRLRSGPSFFSPPLNAPTRMPIQTPSSSKTGPPLLPCQATASVA